MFSGICLRVVQCIMCKIGLVIPLALGQLARTIPINDGFKNTITILGAKLPCVSVLAN